MSVSIHCCREDWKDYFDLYITNARKPGFFKKNSPFVATGRPGYLCENIMEETLKIVDALTWFEIIIWHLDLLSKISKSRYYSKEAFCLDLEI